MPDTSALTRRQAVWLTASAGVATGAASDSLPTRPLGRTGFSTSILGLGAQRLGEPIASDADMDRVVAEAVDAGLNYIDTAPTYGLSQERLGHALKGRRDRVFLVTKVQTLARGDVLMQIRDSLRKLGTDHLDCVHIHNLSRDDRYPSLDFALSSEGTLGGLLEAKRLGLTRFIGCTSHFRAGRILPALATGEFDLVMCTLNNVERHIYNFEETVLPECRKRGIGVIAMKVLGGPVQGPGARLQSPRAYETTLRYVWSLPGVSVAILGLRSPAELKQALAAARAFKPFSETEMSAAIEMGRPVARDWGTLRGPVA
ncbi:MAG: aldo/keto reductase [Bryobacterales bacterium]|nr:aldo/keto reductase [Bryobacterales bacterium]